MNNKFTILIFLVILTTLFVSCSNQDTIIVNEQDNINVNADVESTNYIQNLEELPFDEITMDGCLNKCGNSICDADQCINANCICEETIENCLIDCE